MSSMIASSCPTISLSVHAPQRAQQRAISLNLSEMLLDHGARVPAGDGEEIVHFTAATRRECASEIDRGFAAKLGSAYAAVGADRVFITIGHRFRRLGRR